MSDPVDWLGGDRVAPPALLREGFAGERMSVLPRPRVSQALASPGTAGLLVTDCGYFPHARSHGRVRPRGITQTVVLICVMGEGWCEVEGYPRIDLHVGEIAVLPAGRPHSYAASESNPWTLWWLHVEGNAVAGLIRALNPRSLPVIRRMRDQVRMASLASEVLYWHEKDTTDTSLIAAGGTATHLLALIATGQPARPGRQISIESAAQHLRTNLAGHVSVSELAAMAGLSRSHFAMLFKEHTGRAVGQYQTELRMKRARELLDTTDMPIERIAGLVGYDDSYYFSRQFKQVHGMSPRPYRRHEKG